jgi:hypothetical protein
VPYLIAQPDPYDGLAPNPVHTWTASLPVSTVEARYSLGRLVQIAVLGRDGNGPLGGRVLSLRLVGSARSVVVSGPDFRFAFGLRSHWFAFTGPKQFPKDWTGDGFADVAVRDAAGRLVLYTGAAPGTLGNPAVIGVGWGGMDVLMAAGQWDGVGGHDVLVRSATSGAMILYPRTSAGAWSRPRTVGTGWGPFRAMTSMGDFTGDGRADLLTIRTATAELMLVRGGPSGALTKPVALGARWGATRKLLGPGDFDGDGFTDLISVTNLGRLYLYRGNGRGGFRDIRQIGNGWSPFAEVWSAGDITGDARPDVLALTQAGEVLVYANSGGVALTRAGTAVTGLGGVTVVR